MSYLISVFNKINGEKKYDCFQDGQRAEEVYVSLKDNPDLEVYMEIFDADGDTLISMGWQKGL